jgi:hypothetical protein
MKTTISLLCIKQSLAVCFFRNSMLISFSVEAPYAPHAHLLEDTMLYAMLVPTTFGDIRKRKADGEEFSLTLALPGSGWDDNSKAYVIEVVPAKYELPAGYLLATLSEWGETTKQHMSSVTLAERLGLAEDDVRAQLTKGMASIKQMLQPASD